MTKPYTIRTETHDDHAAIDAVNFAAFDDDPDMPKMVQDLRNQYTLFPTQSLVAVGDDGDVIGHVMMSYAQVDGDKHLIDVMVLSPLAVLPEFQNQGIGTALINHALKSADDMGSPLLFLEGHHLYYGTRGFENAMELGFRRPSLRIPAKAFQVAKLSRYTPDMTGTLVYKDVHWRHGVGLYR
jgi:putative acetyltransferase